MDTIVDETVAPDEEVEEVEEEETSEETEEVDDGEDGSEAAQHALASVADVAKEVIAGDWGIGQGRRLALSKAGYNVKDVEAEVSRIANKR